MVEYKPWSKELAVIMAQKASKGIFTCLDIEISGQCPFNCVYCESPYRDRKSTLNIKKVCELLSTKQFTWIYICGIGEPTYKSNEVQLLTVLECCRQYGVKCSIFTNLSNLSEQLIDYVKSGILHLVFKFDSQNVDVINSLYHPVGLDIHLTNISKIENLVQFDGKYTNIAASIVPTKKNIDEIPSLIKWCLDRNIFPLVAQLEYAGAAIGIFDQLVLDDDQLDSLKEKLNDTCNEEYKVPFCPAVFAGLSLTYDNKVVTDRRTGLSCHSFWLDDPDLEVVCDDVNKIVSFEELINGVIDKRLERFTHFKRNVKKYKHDVLGGCGGNKDDIFELYIQSMEESLKENPVNNNLRISSFVYLDNNATTQISPAVREVMRPYWELKYANPNSNNGLGKKIRHDIDIAREKVATFLGAKPTEIYFTSSGSEGNNWAINCCCIAARNNSNKNIILTTKAEHTSVYEKIQALEADGYIIEYIDLTPNGDIDIRKLESTFTKWDHVAFASVMLANSETGIINDIANLSKLLKRSNILFHCDAVQALGKLEINVENLGVDYLTVSGHKIFAPKGIGAMYVRSGSPLFPMIYGHQELRIVGGKEVGFRGGTENVAYIVALGQAIEDAYAMRNDENFDERISRITILRDKMEQVIMRESIELGLEPCFYGLSANRVANTSYFGFKGVDAIRLSMILEGRGIYVSLGAACDSGTMKPSRVLIAMNSLIQEEKAIRVSLSEHTTERNIKYFTDNLLESLKKMRKE